MSNLSIGRKLIAGDAIRRTRFHDCNGKRAAFTQSVLFPLRLWQKFAIKVFNIYPKKPWWPSEVASEIDSILDKKSSKVVEFGSGFSSQWLAARSLQVTSIEHNAQWASVVRSKAKDAGASNLTVVEKNKEAYAEFDPAWSDVTLFIIDGIIRGDCAASVVSSCSPKSYIYLDNSDVVGSTEGTEEKRARDILLQFAERTNRKVEHFRGFPPGTLIVTEGTLIHAQAT